MNKFGAGRGNDTEGAGARKSRPTSSAATFCPECGAPGGRIHAFSCSRYPDVQTAATSFESAHPELRSEPAARLGREGMVTVWDEEGRYVGCMGVELWRYLLTVETT